MEDQLEAFADTIRITDTFPLYALEGFEQSILVSATSNQHFTTKLSGTYFISTKTTFNKY
jgi:hypothetical protein